MEGIKNFNEITNKTANSEKAANNKDSVVKQNNDKNEFNKQAPAQHVDLKQAPDTFESSENKNEKSSKGLKILALCAIGLTAVAGGAYAAKQGWLGENLQNKFYDIADWFKAKFKKTEAPKPSEASTKTSAETGTKPANTSTPSVTPTKAPAETAAVAKTEVPETKPTEANVTPTSTPKPQEASKPSTPAKPTAEIPASQNKITFKDANGNEIEGIIRDGQHAKTSDGSPFTGVYEEVNNSGGVFSMSYKDGKRCELKINDQVRDRYGDGKQFAGCFKASDAELTTKFDDNGNIKEQILSLYNDKGELIKDVPLSEIPSNILANLNIQDIFKNGGIGLPNINLGNKPNNKDDLAEGFGTLFFDLLSKLSGQ